MINTETDGATGDVNSPPTPPRRHRTQRIALVFAIAVFTAPLGLAALGASLAMPAGLRSSEAIVVNGGTPARTQHALTLYHQGLAPELWHTAYPIGRGRITEAVVAQGGVPREAFHFLATSNTWTDGSAIVAQLRARQIHSIVLVTDWWHSRRALCSLHSQLGGYSVEIVFSPAPAPAGPADWWRDQETRKHVVSELAKIGYYVVRYGMRPWRC